MCKTRFELASISTSRPKRDPLDRSGTCTILSDLIRTDDQQITINFYSLSLYQLSYAEISTVAGFEPTRAKPNRFQVCLLNHSDTLSVKKY